MRPTAEQIQSWALPLLCVLALVIAVQRIASPFRKAAAVPLPPVVTCKGDPIRVSYPFNGGYIEDHACKPQCRTSKQRYVLYSNGKATQCGTPPNCNDTGEDTGVTCTPPARSS